MPASMDLALSSQRGTQRIVPRITSCIKRRHQDYNLRLFANEATRNGWAGPCGTMWRLAHDFLCHDLHARKPFVITTENLLFSQGAYEDPLAAEWRLGCKCKCRRSLRQCRQLGRAARTDEVLSCSWTAACRMPPRDLPFLRQTLPFLSGCCRLRNLRYATARS